MKTARKLNPGTIRALALRTMQVVVYSSALIAYLIAFIGMEANWLTVGMPFMVGIVYLYLDYKYILSQEMKFFYDINPGFVRLESKVDELLER